MDNFLNHSEEDRHSNMVGQNISHYKLLEKLGEGGMGIIYKTEDTKLERIVALKFPSSQVMKSDTEKVRFLREAKAAAALDHPNICTIYEIDEIDGKTFIAMAYVDGENLEEMIRSGPLPLDDALDIAIQIAEGLREAHENGIIHRDIKSANIMLTSRGQVKILDFGLARLLKRSRVTKEATVMGTVAYMSPEQATGKSEIDHRTDLWSLGVVLYEMLTGRVPFEAPNNAALIHQIIYEHPEPIGSVRSGMPVPLERIVYKMIQKNPALRYNDMDALINDLKSVGDQSSVSPTVLLTEEEPAPSIEHEAFSLHSPLTLARRSAFVGRNEEFRRLREHWDASCRGERQVVFLSGEPGIGKTRLATEFADSLQAEGAIVLSGGTEEGAELPYQPFVEALRLYVSQSSQETLKRQIMPYATELTRILPELHQHIPELSVLPLPSSDSERYRLFEALAGCFTNIARFQPVLLMLEDLHWANKQTAFLLNHIARLTAQSRLFILGTYRDKELARTHPLLRTIADLRRSRTFRRISMTGLDELEIEKMMEEWVGRDAPKDIITAVHKHSDGNPFFVEEILLFLIESSAIYEKDGRCMANISVEQMEIPEEVKEVIRLRLSRLSSECDSTLTIASVIGHEFTLEALKRASDLSESKLLELLEEAVAASIIRESSNVVGRYAFCHFLTHETLYEDLTTTRRVRLHGQTLQYADNNGVKLAYEVLGGKGPYLVAAGFSNCPAVRPRNWSLNARWEHVAGFCRVILYDRRGVGFSEAPEKGYDLAASTEDLLAVLDAVGATRPFLYGATDGGPLAIALAAHYPDRVSGLILAGATPRLLSSDDFPYGINPAAFGSFLNTADADPGHAVAELTRSRSGAEKTEDISEFMGRIPPHAWSEILASTGTADALELLPQIDTPTLIIHDPENNYIPVGAAYYMHEHIPNSELEITPDYGGEAIGLNIYRRMERFVDEVVSGRSNSKQ